MHWWTPCLKKKAVPSWMFFKSDVFLHAGVPPHTAGALFAIFTLAPDKP